MLRVRGQPPAVDAAEHLPHPQMRGFDQHRFSEIKQVGSPSTVAFTRGDVARVSGCQPLVTVRPQLLVSCSRTTWSARLLGQNPRDQGRGRPVLVDVGSPGNGVERPSRIPRSTSPLRTGLPGGAVSSQLQLRVLNGFGSLPTECGSALARVVPATPTTRAIARAKSSCVITWSRLRSAIRELTYLDLRSPSRPPFRISRHVHPVCSTANTLSEAFRHFGLQVRRICIDNGGQPIPISTHS
jgi:hypothetical protein